MTETTTKNYSGFLIVNWKNDDIRFRQTKPSKSERSPYETPVKTKVAVEVPDLDIPEISTTLQIPEVQVKEAVSDLTDVEFEDESEFPEPRKVMFQEAQELKDDLDEFEEQDGFEPGEHYVTWLRTLLSYEYENRGRQDVVNLLENRLVEVKSDE